MSLWWEWRTNRYWLFTLRNAVSQTRIKMCVLLSYNFLASYTVWLQFLSWKSGYATHASYLESKTDTNLREGYFWVSAIWRNNFATESLYDMYLCWKWKVTFIHQQTKPISILLFCSYVYLFSTLASRIRQYS